MVVFVFASGAWAGDYYAVGVQWFENQNYNKASENFEKAVKINPKNVNARYYLAQSYLMQKRISEATNQYNRIIILSPSSEAARLSAKGLSLVQQAYLAKGGVSKAPEISGYLSKYKDNYLNYILSPSGTTMRWASFPVTVYIQPKKQKEAAKGAFLQWQEKSNNLVSFKFVNSAKEAQLKVDFQNQLETTSTKESYIAGYSKPYYQDNKLIGSEIHILAVDPGTKKEIEGNDISFSTLHEIGHSLGFLGHSPNKDDVMAGHASGAKTSLTQRDINTLMVFYKIEENSLIASTKGSSETKLQQALDYVKATPDKAVGWGNLGDIYRGKKMYPEAVKSYKKAISLEPEKADSYNLLGSAYSSMGDKKNAFENYKKACDLDKTNLFYIYQFGQLCLASGQKEIGRNYITAFIKANPQSLSDGKIQELIKAYR